MFFLFFSNKRFLPIFFFVLLSVDIVFSFLLNIIVKHYDLTLETFKHLQVFPVFRILLCYDLPGAEEVPACDRHPDEQGFHPVENI